MSRRTIFNKYAKKGIYLTRYWLAKAEAGETIKTKDVQHLTNPIKGAYVLINAHDEWCKSVSKALIATDERGREREFTSLIDAEKQLDQPNGRGNIRYALVNGVWAYGFTWRYKEI